MRQHNPAQIQGVTASAMGKNSYYFEWNGEYLEFSLEKFTLICCGYGNEHNPPSHLSSPSEVSCVLIFTTASRFHFAGIFPAETMSAVPCADLSSQFFFYLVKSCGAVEKHAGK